MSGVNPAFYEKLAEVLNDDHQVLIQKGASYGDSWKKRGGVGAYMMLCRKIDRIAEAVENPDQEHRYDIFAKVAHDNRAEGLIDDIRDLRRYLALVETELRMKELITSDNPVQPPFVPLNPPTVNPPPMVERPSDVKRGTASTIIRKN